jgi:hypothetical protein
MRSLFSRPPLLLSIIIVLAFAIIMKVAADRQSLPPVGTGLSGTEVASAIPDYTVTPPGVIHEDELEGDVIKRTYRCDQDRYFTVRFETDEAKLGRAEVFLADYSKLLLTSTVTASLDDHRYVNAGETFILMTTGDRSTAQIFEEIRSHNEQDGSAAGTSDRTYVNCTAQ